MKQIQVFILFTVLISYSNLSNAQITTPVTPRDGGWYKIQVVQTGKYLAIEGVSKENGARLVQWDYVSQDNHKFFVKKNEDGSYSFLAGHSGKAICADKGDNREGDIIIQNSLPQYFGKWYLNGTKQLGCREGFRILYGQSSGKPIQLTGGGNGGGFQLVEQQYHDADLDCAYTFLFEEVAAPKMVEKIESKLPNKPGAIIKRNNQ